MLEKKYVGGDGEPELFSEEEEEKGTKEEECKPLLSTVEEKKPRITKRMPTKTGRITKEKVKLPDVLDEERYFDLYTTPIDGDDPQIYSNNIQFINPYSYLTHSMNPQDRVKKKHDLPSPPTYLRQDEIYIHVRKTIDDYLRGWGKNPNGSLKITDKAVLKKQAGAFLEIIKRMAKSLFNSDIMGMSMPASIHENRSMTTRLLDYMRVAHLYWIKASGVTDHLERFKLHIVAVLTGFSLDLVMDMPFNPLLGETCQAGYEDGSLIYVEQLIHHPATTGLLIFGPGEKYRFRMFMSAIAHFTPNTMKIVCNFKNSVEFNDGHKVSCLNYPVGKMKGILSGYIRFHMTGPMYFEDETEGYKGVLFFNYGVAKGFIKKNKDVGKDKIEGIIYIPKKGVPVPKKPPKRIADLTDIQTELARISGSWLEGLSINGVNYWQIEKSILSRIIYANNPIPSDVRFREDVIWVHRAQFQKGQAWKDAIEIRQRDDRKLREAWTKKNKGKK